MTRDRSDITFLYLVEVVVVARGRYPTLNLLMLTLTTNKQHVTQQLATISYIITNSNYVITN